jgi:transcription elongation factor Elf1
MKNEFYCPKCSKWTQIKPIVIVSESKFVIKCPNCLTPIIVQIKTEVCEDK